MPRIPILLALLAGLILFAPSPGLTRERSNQARTVPIHYKQQNLAEIVRNIARATNRQFIHSSDLTGRITITVPGRVSEAEALELLNAALFLKGFTGLPIGDGATKIVPIAETSSGSPLVDEDLDDDRERPITTLLRLKHANAQSIATSLGPLLPQSGFGIAYPPTNSLILAGSEAQVSRLVRLTRLMDRAAAEDVGVYTLRYREASTLAEMVDTTFNQQKRNAQRVEIWTDERTNQLIALARPERLEKVRNFIRDFDRPLEGKGLIRVVPILNHDAEKLAEILDGMAEEPKSVANNSLLQGPSSFGQELSGRSFSITADPATRSLLLVADAETLEVLIALIRELDRLPARVQVDVLVFEVTRPSSFEVDFDYFLPLVDPERQGDPLVFISTASPSLEISPEGVQIDPGIPSGPSQQGTFFGRYARDPLVLTLEDDQGETTSLTIPREDVAFELGESRGRATILMRPSLTVVNGEESVVFVGNNIPVPVGNSAAAGTTEDANDNRSFPSTRQRIERQDVGIELRVKPTTGSGGMVTLEFDLDLSALGVSAAGDVDRVGPTFMNRSINSKLRLFENEYAIIGAGSEVGEDEIRSGIPFLMKIPLLGQFFRSTSKSSVTSDLIAVVKARILRSPEEDAAEAIRRRIALERAVARTPDLNAPGENPFALLLETFRREEAAAEVVEAFREDGFETRVTSWLASDGKLWDVYLTGFPSFEEAAGLARGLSEAGWSPEVEVLSPENELAGD